MFDGISNWWNGLWGGKKKEEKRQQAQQPTTTAPTIRNTSAPQTTPALQAKQPTIAQQKTAQAPTIQVGKPTNINSNVIAMTAPKKPEDQLRIKDVPPSSTPTAPQMLTPQAQREWSAKKNDEQKLNRATQTNDTREIRRQAYVNRSMQNGTSRDRAEKAAGFAIEADDAALKAREAQNFIKAFDNVTEIPRRSASGYLKFLASTPGNLAGAAGAAGAAVTPDDWGLDKTFHDWNKWGVQTNSDISNNLDKVAKSEHDGVLGDLGESFGQLGGTVLTSIIPGGAVANSVNFGAQEAGRQFHDAKEAGKSDLEAGAIATGAGITQAVLEKIGLDKLMGRSTGNAITNMTKKALVEGSQEGAQQFSSNAFEKTYNNDKDLMDNVAYSALLGGVTGGTVGGAMHYAQNRTPRDADAPKVTTIAPQNEAEKNVAVQNGIVTPATKSLSVDEKIQTALNSDIGEQVRSRQQGDAHLSIDQPLSTMDYSNLNAMYRNIQDYIDVPPELMKDLPSDISARDAVARIVQNTPQGPLQYEVLSSLSYLLKQSGYKSWDNFGFEQAPAPGDTVQNRLGQPGENITRSDMQNIQLENNRMFGDVSPNVDFKNGVILTPDGNVAVGSTTDSRVGHSKIAIAKQQGDPQATYLHEAVHKSLNDYTTQDERTQILMSYSTDKRVNEGTSEAEIEEMMAEDFIQYVASRKNENAPAPTLTQKVRDIFERIFKRLQLVTAKMAGKNELTPEYRQFYNDLFSGRYANEAVIDKNLRNASAEHLQLQDHRDMLKEQFDNTDDAAARRAISEQLTDLNSQIRSAEQYRPNDNTKFRTNTDQTKTKMTRKLRAAIDELIYEQNPDIASHAEFQSIDTLEPQLGEAYGDRIPRIHVDDLKHYLGASYESIPVTYRRRTGKRDIDELAKLAGYDDVDTYLEAISTTLESRKQRRDDSAALSSKMKELRQDPETIAKAQEILQSREDKVLKQTYQEYFEERMPATIREYWDEMKAADSNGVEVHPERKAQVEHWAKKNADKMLNEYRNSRAGIYNKRRDKRVEKFSEFTDSKEDAEKLADMSPEAVKVEHINSKTRVLHLPGGDTATKVDVTGPRSSSMQEFAVRSTIDEVTGKQTVELVPLDGQKHTLKNGMVVDKDGKSVGSYASIDDAGNQVAYIEGKPVNITGILGDLNQWGNANHATWDIDRIIEENAPDEDTARRVQKFVTQFKDQQESMMKTELLQKRTELQNLEKDMYKHRPKGVSKKELRKDLFSITEKKSNYAEVVKKYGQDYVDNYIKPTVTWWRKTADTMLEQTNRSLEKNGFDPIPRLDNYITHVQADPSFWSRVGVGISQINPMGGSVSSDLSPGTTRGGVPEAIVGNTENTGARRKWNPFAQARRGSQHEQDFFKAIDSYFEPMLFNKYMTPAASRARVVERTFRTFEEAQKIRKEQRINELAEWFGVQEATNKVNAEIGSRSHKKYKADRTSPLITAWQEYGNMLAGKTNALDRAIIDKLGDKSKKVMDINAKLQGIAGANTIPGSATAAFAQTLSIPQTIGRDSPKNFARGIAAMMSSDGKRAGSNDPMRKSAFMRARYTDASSRRKNALDTYTSKASIPMEFIERTISEISWRSAYDKALDDGLTGKEAILRADMEAKKTIAGRGIGDRPVAMNSKALGIWSQFGLEVNNMRVQFQHDFTPAQKAKFIVAAAGMNFLYGAVAGQSPLPDYIKAALDTLVDLAEGEEKDEDGKVTRNYADKIWGGAQRFAGETAKFVPGAGALADAFLPDNVKEGLFGKDSDVSRFGSPAMTKLPEAIGKAVEGVAEGDLDKVGDAALMVAPTGQQARRTIGGLNTMTEGVARTNSGNVTTTVDQSNPLKWLQAALFGKNALGEVQSVYGNKSFATDKDQTETFENIRDMFGAQAGKEYIDSVRPQDGQANISSSVEKNKLLANVEKKLKSGEYKKEDGVLLTKSGDVVTDYYKALAKSGPEGSESTYEAYIRGYGLSKGTSFELSSSSEVAGNSTLDKLEKAKKKSGSGSSVANNAIALARGDDKLSDIPEWVRNKFYKEAGYTKEQAEYGALASYSTDEKMDVKYRPLAQEGNRDALIQELERGREKGIGGKLAANDAVITALYNEGYLTKDEAKALKGTVVLNGKATTKRRSSKSSGGVTNADIESYLNSTRDDTGSLVSTIMKRYGTASTSSRKITARNVAMRSMKPQQKSKSAMKRVI